MISGVFHITKQSTKSNWQIKNNTMKNKIDKWMRTLKKPNYPDEYEAKLFLNLFGINIPRTIRISPDSNLTFSESNPPFVNPNSAAFAIKVCSPDILHKTEEQGVMLNIEISRLNSTLDTIMQKFPGKDILLEEQIRFIGTEFIIGAINDPDYGISLMAGAGGIMTEIYQDAGFRLAPCSIKEAERMLDELTISPVLHNYRGIMLDRRKLAMAISATGSAALCLGEKFSQLDINPIVFSYGKWVALDANIIFTA